MCRKVLDYCHQIPHLRSGLRSLVGGEGRVENRRFHGSTGEQEFNPKGMGLLRLGSRLSGETLPKCMTLGSH